MSNVDEDAYVSDITHPLNIVGIPTANSYDEETHNLEDESEKLYDNNESSLSNHPQDISKISSKSF